MSLNNGDQLKIEIEDQPVVWEHMRRFVPMEEVDTFIQDVGFEGWELIQSIFMMVPVQGGPTHKPTIIAPPGAGGAPNMQGGFMMFFKRLLAQMPGESERERMVADGLGGGVN